MKTYPVIYKQGDFLDPLGNSTTVTIASGGCFVTSLAMKAQFYGHTVNPSQLNTLFKDNKIYFPEADKTTYDLLPDNALAQAFTDIKYLKTFDYEPIPTDLQNIASLLSDPATTLTVRINLGKGNLHFVEAVNCDGATLHIANPLSGTIEDFSQRYGNPVTANLHVLVYTGPLPQPTPPPPPSPLATNFNNAITKSNNFDRVADFLGISAQQRVTATSGQDVVNLIQQLQTSLQNEEEYAKKLELQVASLTQTKPISTFVPDPTPTGAVFQGGLAPVTSTPASVVPIDTPKASSLPQQAKPEVPLSRQNLFMRIFRILFA